MLSSLFLTQFSLEGARSRLYLQRSRRSSVDTFFLNLRFLSICVFYPCTRGSEVGRQFKIRIHPSAWLFFGKRNVLHGNSSHGTFCIAKFSTVSAPCKRRCSKKVEHKTWNIKHGHIKHGTFCIAKNLYGIYVTY